MAGWISVNDAEPERPQDNETGQVARTWYLVKYTDGFIGETAFEFNNESNQLIKYGFWKSREPGEVTHWLPGATK